MLKLAYRLGFEFALQEALQKTAGPGSFAIPKAEIAKALRPAAKAAPAAQPGIWDKIKGLFNPTEVSNTVVDSPVYAKYRSGIAQQQRKRV